MRIALLILALTVCAAPTNAQTTQPADQSSPSAVFMSRVAFGLSAAHLSGKDPRFVWDANIGTDIDVVDYGTGRIQFDANYQVVLGEEFHAFDPNQGNYTFGGFISRRFPGVEVGGVFHHESRHLADRAKRPPVDWNMLGGRVYSDASSGRARFQTHADFLAVIEKAFVDYKWEVEAGTRGAVRISPNVAFITAGDVLILGVDRTRNRDWQTGFRGEGGFRFQGSKGAVEFFAAGEREIDPYPLEFSTVNRVSLGFRLVTR
jgi:hypothetical protein